MRTQSWTADQVCAAIEDEREIVQHPIQVRVVRVCRSSRGLKVDLEPRNDLYDRRLDESLEEARAWWPDERGVSAVGTRGSMTNERDSGDWQAMLQMVMAITLILAATQAVAAQDRIPVVIGGEARRIDCGVWEHDGPCRVGVHCGVSTPWAIKAE